MKKTPGGGGGGSKPMKLEISKEERNYLVIALFERMHKLEKTKELMPMHMSVEGIECELSGLRSIFERLPALGTSE